MSEIVTKEYSEAVVEVLDILEHTRKTDVEKIPKQLIEFFEKVKSTTYISNINHSKPLNSQELKAKTKALIGMIYANYWCTNEEKQELEKIQMENYEQQQEELRIKYDPDNIFKNKNQRNENIKNTELIVYKETFFSKIINKIKKLFIK